MWYQGVDILPLHNIAIMDNTSLACIDNPQEQSLFKVVATTFFAIGVKSYITLSSICRAWSHEEFATVFRYPKWILTYYFALWLCTNVGLSCLTAAGVRSLWLSEMYRSGAPAFASLLAVPNVVGSGLANEICRCVETSRGRRSAINNSSGVKASVPLVIFVGIVGIALGATMSWNVMFSTARSSAGTLMGAAYVFNVLLICFASAISVILFCDARRGGPPKRTPSSCHRLGSSFHHTDTECPGTLQWTELDPQAATVSGA